MYINRNQIIESIDRMLFVAYGEIKEDADDDLQRLREVNDKFREFLSA